jgi:hypothetical protein
MFSSNLFLLLLLFFQVVPCFVRRQFNTIVGRILDDVSTDGKEYNLNVNKMEYKTTIFGTAY